MSFGYKMAQDIGPNAEFSYKRMVFPSGMVVALRSLLKQRQGPTVLIGIRSIDISRSWMVSGRRLRRVPFTGRSGFYPA